MRVGQLPLDPAEVVLQRRDPVVGGSFRAGEQGVRAQLLRPAEEAAGIAGLDRETAGWLHRPGLHWLRRLVLPTIHLFFGRHIFQDTVIAAIGCAWAVGSTLEDAVQLANIAAGIVVGKLGAATASPAEIIHELSTQEG